ncbi:DNA repair protein RecO [Geobacter sp. OR-1]|uniref:DNA repair protein RecO n=1 Tax=Geobacter sp. OR-1 TaxID=1266765 RepID=UPI0005421212|nr:DNA repair protein RecO [Geobacter sp. OR-1]GAM09807.1 DNA repair protein RecO [Geobacter sp. OR-1]
MEIGNCRGVVLNLADYRESDRLVTLFTLEHGRISGIARGARRSVKRFGGALELFALLNLQVKFRNALSELLEADIVTIHSGIRSDLNRIAHAAYASDLIATFSPEGLANQRLFRLLTAYLAHLDAGLATVSDRRFFEINLLNIIGYRPELDQCSRCGSLLGEGAERAGRIFGGEVVCRRCGISCREISAETLELLSRSLKTGRFGLLSFSSATLDEAGALLDNAIESHLEKPLRSLAFLRELGDNQIASLPS